ncbi:MAG: aspartate/glutamate racemase family protein [Melioribacteraceae bacterium]|nr:aspartate/glutamate racemase family protein [Melioribacteraceae bacterium]
MLPENLKSKASPVIVVTDSGYGGLSVLSEIERIITSKRLFEKAELIFFNAVPDRNRAYNQMTDMTEKAVVFSSVLNAIHTRFNPDAVLIACNTLSVVFEHTDFFRSNKLPVLGIVDPAVEMINNKLKKANRSIALLLGTPTTIESDAYKLKLVRKGIVTERIINQSCYMLESEIQNDPAGPNVSEMINKYISEAVNKNPVLLDNDNKVIVSLCCTHYGYALDQFDAVLKKIFNGYEIVNPDSEIIHKLLDVMESDTGHRGINVKVYSKTSYSRKERENIGAMIKANAGSTYHALMNYFHDSHLFGNSE